MPSQTPDQGQKMVKLDFPEKLIQTGKKENTDALLKRLKTLHQKLAALEQDFTDIRSLDPVRKPLISQLILHHKDRGVKAYAACCLADLLRLYAPDAPYTGEELRDIFQFFSAQLITNLRASPSQIRPLQPSRSKANEASQISQASQASQRITDVAYYTEYYYLIESLATIRSVILACDVPGGEELVSGFFEGFAEVVRPDMSKNLLRHLVDILVAVVEESGQLPSGVMDCIISQFTDHASRPETPSFQLMVDVCNRCPDRLHRPILAHFSEIQLKHGRYQESSDNTEMSNSHDLLLTIYRHCPGLLLNVIPMLEENLRVADEVNLRQLTTKTLGTMFGERPMVGAGVADIARAYPSAWRSWLGRKVDKAILVRLAWVDAAKGILTSHPELHKALEIELVDRIQDSDERVRAAICKVIGSLDYETALHHISQKTLRAVGDRMSDKRAAVRTEASAALAKLWTAAYSEIEASDSEAVGHFAWIPEAMLHCLCRKDAPLELKSQMSATFKNSILPLPAKPDEEQAWVDRLLLVATTLDDSAFKALDLLTGLRGYAKGSSPYKAFILFCEENNGGVIDGDEKMVKARLDYVIGAISSALFVDGDKARKDMEAFAAANEARLYKLFKTCADPQTDLRTLVKSRNELLRRLEQSHTDILDTFSTIIDAASWMTVNHSSIPPLIKRLQRPEAPNVATTVARLLSLIAKECAPMYKSHVAELVIVMADKKNEKLAEMALQALAAVSKADPSCAPDDRRPAERAIKMVMQGTPRQAKFAARFLAYCKHKDACSELIETIVDDLVDPDGERLLCYIRALSELALSAPAAFEKKSGEIVRFIMEEVMLKQSKTTEDEPADEWVEEPDLALLDRAKIIGMRVVTHRSLGFARDPNALAIVQPTFDLLCSILKNDGMVNDGTGEGGHARCHMRLRAALCMVKLANVKVFDKAIPTADFENIAFVMQDPCFQVRNHFLRKLGEVLPAQRLLPRWNLMPSLGAMDPEAENVFIARNVILSVVRSCTHFRPEERIDRIEMPLARLLSALTHHPDCQWDVAGLKDISKFIELYLDCTATRDNVAMLLGIAAKIKTVKDADKELTDNSNLYGLSELVQVMIKNRADALRWPVTSYPGKIRLPRDIFHNLNEPKDVLEVTRKTYLPVEILEWAGRGLGKRPGHITGPSKRVNDPASSPVKKRTKSAKATPRKKRRSAESDEDDDDAESEVDGSDEEGGEASESDEEEEAEEGEAVIGRGGRRGAKTKAKRKVAGKTTKKAKKPKADTGMDVDGTSDLTDLEDD